ncbi:MAG: DUF3846 domain-containing protein [Stomatobaculum sp.]|nr:DUF3846 domain-containing protein [Stomatobaculum sp.]
MKEKIRDLVKEPGKVPEEREIGNTLEALQNAVDGYIETVTLAEDLVIICNEEGRLYGLQPNCRVSNLRFCGTILFAGAEADEFADLPATVEEMKMMFPNLWEEAG